MVVEHKIKRKEEKKIISLLGHSVISAFLFFMDTKYMKENHKERHKMHMCVENKIKQK